ncbi:MAG: CNNM domain-containing protein [Phycisphaerales bacterium JB043]
MYVELLKLFLYLNLAVVVSFACSMCEACLLTLSRTDAQSIAASRPRIGKMLDAMKKDIDRPLAAILTLNTISHTVGAAGVGAEAAIIFGGWIGVTSAILTLIILVFSEIVPKTLGAVHARRLAPLCVVMIHWMIVLTYPIVATLEILSRVLKRGSDSSTPTREELMILAELVRVGGDIDAEEATVIQNILRLREIRVESVMTPRTVVFMLPANQTVAQVLERHASLDFTRIPLYGTGPDHIVGVVLRKDIYEAMRHGRGDTPLQDIAREIDPVPLKAVLIEVLRRFSRAHQHLLYVVDEFGGTAGVISLEDVLETVLGMEIVDETDSAPDLRALARRRKGN